MNQTSSAFVAILTNLSLEDSPMITIQCNGGNIDVKKVILTAISDVFKTMFGSDMAEKRTNLVSAEDVDFETMETIFDYYANRNGADFNKIKANDFGYIVQKYNFIGIKEIVAKALLDKYRENKDISVLENIFTTYDCQAPKMVATTELAIMIASGGKGPKYITNFTVPDFLSLSKICCASLKETEFESCNAFFNSFYNWVSQNPDERSVAAIEIIGMIDIRKFSVSDVLQVLKSLPLSKEIQVPKLMFEKSLSYIADCNEAMKNHNTLCERSAFLECEICGHKSKYPFHYSPTCNGKYTCVQPQYPCDVHGGWYGKYISYGQRQNIFSSLTYHWL
ncbi:uncharacterized protein LOC136035528 isoform X1 [Artemia franciscana]|uniref:uncharacterized protein LOC136035528 isoform X1 n=1 Tax=Artemia franciscana TaxID=6661 RepID=UPI0032D9E85D